MNTFEDKLQASARRLMAQDNKRMHVPQNPLGQKGTYWGWVATPAAAVVGIIFGMSLHLFMNNKSDTPLAQSADTIRIFQLVHDTLYMTKIVEKEKILVREVAEKRTTERAQKQETSDIPTCTSIQCDGINYAILASRTEHINY